MVLFLHNRYRTSGGEERTVEDLLWLVREQMGEPAELLTRDSAGLGRTQAAVGLLRGGLAPEEVAQAVRLSGARVVHAHNVQPALGWRALAAARAAGARVVLHLHQYRLVCAIGVCFTRGAECTRCHGRDTLPGVRLNCRGSVPEALAYGASLALWQRRLVEQADAVIVPSRFARERLRELGAPLPWDRVHVIAPPVREPTAAAGSDFLMRSGSPAGATAAVGSYALVVARLAPEKGVDVAIDACRLAGMSLVVAGDFDAQCRQTFRNIEKTLAEAGAKLADLVTMTVFLIDARHTTRMTELRTEIFGKDFPASAAITVAGFALPEMMIEIQCVAVVS